jgi:hypothetical protein
MGPITLALPQPEVPLRLTSSQPYRYENPSPIPLVVSSQFARWTLQATLLPLNGPTEDPEFSCQIQILPPAGPQLTSLPSAFPLSVGKPTPVLHGGFGVTEYGVKIIATPGPFAGAGTYQGTIHLTVIDPNSKIVLYEERVRFNYAALPYVFFYFEAGGLNFSASGEPGTVISPRPHHVVVSTNRASVRVRFSISPLTHQSGSPVIPISHLGIGVGSTPEEAIRNAESAPFGVPGALATATRGHTHLYIAVKVRSELTQPPGAYRGTLTGEVIE